MEPLGSAWQTDSRRVARPRLSRTAGSARRTCEVGRSEPPVELAAANRVSVVSIRDLATRGESAGIALGCAPQEVIALPRRAARSRARSSRDPEIRASRAHIPGRRAGLRGLLLRPGPKRAGRCRLAPVREAVEDLLRAGGVDLRHEPALSYDDQHALTVKPAGTTLLFAGTRLDSVHLGG